MDSVIIPLDTKELLLEDAKDFLDSEEWYGQRGIPWQRGWLFYGMLPPLRSTCGQVANEPVPLRRRAGVWQGKAYNARQQRWLAYHVLLLCPIRLPQFKHWQESSNFTFMSFPFRKEGWTTQLSTP